MRDCLSLTANFDGCIGRNILDHFTDKVMIFDSNCRCVYANKAVVDYCSAFKVTCINNFVADWYNAFTGDPDKWESRLKEAFSTGAFAEYFDIDRINGEGIYSESALIPMFNHSAQPVSVVLVFKNLTEKKLLQKQLEINSKLAELGKALAYLTHEMKTPLNSIIMNVDILSEDQNITGAKKNSINLIRQELHRLSRMMRSILKFAHFHTETTESANINSVINDVHQLIRPVLRQNNIILHNNCDEQIVSGREQDIESVLLELINNAIDAIGKNGYINIYSGQNEDEGKVSIFIKDSGKGIEDPDKIFLPFYSTKKEGNGIGLPQIIKTLRNINASINLVSSGPGSTVFELIFNKHVE